MGGAFVAVNGELDAIGLAEGDLADRDVPEGAVVHAQEDGGVVVQDAAGDSGAAGCAEGGDFVPGGPLGEVGAGAGEIDHGAGGTATAGVDAPTGGTVAGGLKADAHPAMVVADVDAAEVADGAGKDGVAEGAEGGIEGEDVGGGVELGTHERAALQVLRLVHVAAHGLFGEDGEACVEGRHRHGVMHIVRRENGDEIHAALAGDLGLAPKHIAVDAVNAGGVEPKGLARLERALPRGTEGAADQLQVAAGLDSRTVNAPHEGLIPAANHRDLKFGLLLCHLIYLVPLCYNICPKNANRTPGDTPGVQKTENRKQKTETRGKRATDEAAEQSWCVFRENTKDTKNHKEPQRHTKGEPQIAQICCRLRAC